MARINIKDLLIEGGVGNSVAWTKITLSVATWVAAVLSSASWTAITHSTATWTSVSHPHIADYYLDGGDIVKEA